MIKYVKVKNKDDVKGLALVAETIWNEYFTCILSRQQIDYMVDKFQSLKAITKQINEENYTYFFIQDDDIVLGYIGLQAQNDGNMYLSKLYLAKKSRGLGLGGKALDFACKYAHNNGFKRVWLTCNKHNDHSLDVYKHKGFTQCADKVTDIGNGYVMDDYWFEKMV